jgi:O-antigen ligase
VVALAVGLFMLLDEVHGLLILVVAQFLLVGTSGNQGLNALKLSFAGLFACFYAGWLARTILIDRRSLESVLSQRLCKPAAAFCLVLLVSLPVALSNSIPFVDWLRDASQFLGYLLVFAVASTVRTKKEVARLLALLGVIVVVSSVVTSFYWAAQRGLGPAVPEATFVATSYAVILLACTMSLSFLVAGETTRPRLAWLAASVVFSLLLILTGTRASLIGLVVGVLTLLGRKGVGRHLLWGAFVALIVILLAGVALASPRLEYASIIMRRYTSSVTLSDLWRDVSVRRRVDESRAALDAFAQRPLLGQGFGFRLGFLSIPTTGGSQLEWNDPGRMLLIHPGYHSLLAKSGLVGFAVFAWYMLTLLFELDRLAKHSAGLVRTLSLGILAWILAVAALSISSSTFDDRAFALLIGIFAGLIPVFHKLGRNGSSSMPVKAWMITAQHYGEGD